MRDRTDFWSTAEGRPGRVTSLAVVLSACLVALQACTPRGETQSLQDIFAAAKERYYRQSSSAGLGGDVSKSLQEVSSGMKDMEALVKGGPRSSDRAGLRTKSAEVAKVLHMLDRRAGYTTRPSLAELATQYDVFSTGASGAAETTEADKAALKLLMARTYNLLASELETTKFGLN